jgi:mannose-1-phosphate guanylyltransferase
MAVLPADHYIELDKKYREIVSAALDVARHPGRMVVLGIPPTRPETGFGYVERMSEPIGTKGFPVFPVLRFTEKPELKLAQEYVATGNYHWNAGMFFWRVFTFLECLKEFLPKTRAALEDLSAYIGTRSYERKLRAIYPKLENISVDYAVLEPATRVEGAPRVFVIPAEVGWSDIGSWGAVHGLLLDKNSADGNVFLTPGHALDARGNLISSPGKYAALIGVHDLIVVDTPDALLICPRGRAQDVGKIVKWLEEQRRRDLL